MTSIIGTLFYSFFALLLLSGCLLALALLCCVIRFLLEAMFSK